MSARNRTRLIRQRREFLIGQNGGVLESLLNVLRLKIRILAEDLRNCHTVGDKIYNKRYSDAQTPNARSTTHYHRVKAHAIEGQRRPHVLLLF
jgi:hypothetical protein